MLASNKDALHDACKSCIDREINKNNLLGGQFSIILPKNPGK